MPFNVNTYEAIFNKADQVWDSNRAAEPPTSRPVAATNAAPVKANSAEVSAVQKGQGQGRNKNRNRNGQSNGQNRGQNRGQGNQNGQGQSGQKDQKPAKPAVNEDNLCKLHAKWKENANFCSAPWACRMKNIYKAPQ